MQSAALWIDVGSAVWGICGIIVGIISYQTGRRVVQNVRAGFRPSTISHRRIRSQHIHTEDSEEGVRSVKIAVLVKQTPDTAELPKVSAEEVKSGELKVTMVINPWDEYAAEEAVHLGERFGAESVAISMGPTTAVDALKHALAMGVSEAVLVDSTGVPVDIGTTSAILASAVQAQGDVDLVITGKQSVDAGTGSVYVGVACKLGYPLVSNVVKIVKIDDGIDRRRPRAGRATRDGLGASAGRDQRGQGDQRPALSQLHGHPQGEPCGDPSRHCGGTGRRRSGKKTVWTNVRKPDSAGAECVMIEGATAQEQAARLVDALMGEKVI